MCGRKGVALALAQPTAKEMSPGLKFKVQQEKYNEYEIPVVCLQICDNSMTVSESSSLKSEFSTKLARISNKTSLGELLERVNIPQSPRYITISTFHKIEPQTNKAHGVRVV